MSIRRNFNRIVNVRKYGKIHALQIVSEHPELKQKVIFRDILRCYRKYRLFSNQYKKEKFWMLSEEQREIIGNKNKEKFLRNERWLDDFFQNGRFLNKWKRFKYESSGYLQSKRINAYRKRYNMGENCHVGHDVIIERHHYLWGTIKIGNNCLLAKHVYIDYSGDLIIHDNVSLANGVIIETHTHPIGKRGAAPQPGRLEIERGVTIFTGSYIADTCHFIGRYAMIGAGTYIRGNVLPYAIMIGNPAKIVGFMYSPEEVEEFEKNVFPEDERIDVEKYRQDYKKYFIDRRKEIKSFLQK